jgi:Xaa-Pro aminopeptidase
MFAPQVYRQRRAALRRKLSSGLLLLPGHAESPVNFGANPYPFRQDSSFLYYAGLDQPDALLLIDIDHDRETLLGPAVSLEEAVWTGPRPTLAEQAARAGIADVGQPEEAGPAIAQALQTGRRVHYLPAYRADQMLRLSGLLGVPPDRLNDGASLAFIRAVVSQRSIKTAAEVAEIESALGLCRDLWRALLQRLPGVISALELANVLEGIVCSTGHRWAFTPIVTCRGEILHAPPDDTPFAPGDLLLMDFGAESQAHYASDITRTIPVGGRFSAHQRAVYEIVLAAQKAAIAAAAPGVKFLDLHRRAATVLCEGLCDLGLMHGRVDDAVEAGAHALFFPHGLGHMLGLDVHDMESLGEDNVGYDGETQRSTQFGTAALRLGRRLEAGFVVTVEPGLYFIPALIDRWRQEKRWSSFIAFEKLAPYRRFGGIRIEDVVLVTPDGARILGPGIPKTPAEVAASLGASIEDGSEDGRQP